MSEEARREQLLELGTQLFAEKRFDALPMEEIAKKAGVSKPLLFHYFGSKRGYYVASVEEVARQVTEATAPLPDLPFEKTIERSLLGYVTFVKNNGALYRNLVRGGIGTDPEVFEILDGVRRLSVQRILDQLDVKRPPALLQTALLGWVTLAETTVLEWHEQRAFSERRLLNMLLATLLSVIQIAGQPGKKQRS